MPCTLRKGSVAGHVGNTPSPIQNTINNVPVHVFPSPEYPELQAHVYDPSVLLHKAFTSQL